MRPSTPLKILGQEASAQLDKGIIVSYRDTLTHAEAGDLVTWLKSTLEGFDPSNYFGAQELAHANERMQSAFNVTSPSEYGVEHNGLAAVAAACFEELAVLVNEG